MRADGLAAVALLTEVSADGLENDEATGFAAVLKVPGLDALEKEDVLAAVEPKADVLGALSVEGLAAEKDEAVLAVLPMVPDEEPKVDVFAEKEAVPWDNPVAEVFPAANGVVFEKELVENDEAAGVPVVLVLEDPLLNEGEVELNAEVVPLFKFFPLSLVLLNVISLRLASNKLFF